MGVDIKPLLPIQEIELEELAFKKIGIDAYNILHQFLSIIRQRDGTPLKDSEGRVTSHLTGLFYRTINLLEIGIRPVFIFDGEPPAFKHETLKERKKRKEEARKKLKKAKEEGKEKEIRKYAQQVSKLTTPMVKESKRLLKAMGLPYVQAPSEGEAQTAYMNQKGDIWATGSQDFDSLVFGTPKLVRNITITGKRKLPGKQKYVEVHPELIKLQEIFNKHEINQEQFIMIALLIGTDFNEGIEGIGPKKGLKLVKEKESFEEVKAEVGWEAEIKEVFDFFKDPEVDEDYKIEFKKPDKTKIKESLVEDHDFSEDRIEKGIGRIEKARKKRNQTQLGGF